MVRQTYLKTNFILGATGGYFQPNLLITLDILKMEHYCCSSFEKGVVIHGASLMVGSVEIRCQNVPKTLNF